MSVVTFVGTQSFSIRQSSSSAGDVVPSFFPISRPALAVTSTWSGAICVAPKPIMTPTVRSLPTTSDSMSRQRPFCTETTKESSRRYGSSSRATSGICWYLVAMRATSYVPLSAPTDG